MNPSDPATMADLYNALAEVNARVTATLELPDWLIIGVVLLMAAALLALVSFAFYWFSKWVEG